MLSFKPSRAGGIASLLLASAFVAFGASQAGAAPFTVTNNGQNPNVALGANGVGHFVWNEQVPGGDSTHYCQIPRGQRVCTHSKLFSQVVQDAAGSTDFSGPQVIVRGNQVVVFTHRCCAAHIGPDGQGYNGITYEADSNDGGLSWPPAMHKASGNDAVLNFPLQSVIDGPGGHISTLGFGTGGTYFQAISNGGFTGAQANLSPDLTTEGASVGMANPGIPLVVMAGGNPGDPTVTYFRRYSGIGDLNNAGSWTPLAAVGPGSEAELASGPRGAFLMYKTGDHYSVRRFDGAGFGPPTAVSESGSPIFSAFYEDPTGTLHALWRDEQRSLAYRTSTDGVHWSPVVSLSPEPAEDKGLYHTKVAAAGNRDGFAVSDSNSQNSTVQAVALGSVLPGTGNKQKKKKKVLKLCPDKDVKSDAKGKDTDRKQDKAEAKKKHCKARK